MADHTKLPKRPLGVVGNAVPVLQIATGEREEEFEPEPQPEDKR